MSDGYIIRYYLNGQHVLTERYILSLTECARLAVLWRNRSDRHQAHVVTFDEKELAV
jgi:hypothetical protein